MDSCGIYKVRIMLPMGTRWMGRTWLMGASQKTWLGGYARGVLEKMAKGKYDNKVYVV